MLEQYNPIMNYIFLFFMFSGIGWAIESTYRSLGEMKIINSGFLFGPMCPIYGTGCLAFDLCLVPLSEPIGKRLWIVLLLGIVLADTVEYFTSWMMEKLFHARWWDYSGKFLNLHGRICFRHSCYWALFAFLYVYFIAPMYRLLLTYINPTIMYTCVGIFFAFFIVDLILTIKTVTDINKLMKKLSGLKDAVANFNGSVKLKAENLIGPSEDSKFNEWKSEISRQYDEIRNQLTDMETAGNKNTRRILSIYGSVRKAAEDGLYEIGSRWEEMKSHFTDSDSEMM